MPKKKKNPKTKKRNPMGPKGKTALGAGVGSLAGAVAGGAVLGPAGALLGSAAGGAVGGQVGAPDDRDKRGAVGGGVGGLIFGPIGAAIGGYIGGGKKDKKKNPHGGQMTKAQTKKILALKDGEEVEIEKIVWTRMDSEVEGGKMVVEYKVSPHGSKGDYDKDAYWVYAEELKEEFVKAFGGSELNPRQSNPAEIKKLKSRLLR